MTRTRLVWLLLLAGLWTTDAAAGPEPAVTAAGPLQPLATLDVAAYLGTWYQVMWLPNRFQKQCVSDTTATYRVLAGDGLEVVNRCRTADGRIDSAIGRARPALGVGRIDAAGRLQPARLEVSFLPAWLRWTGIGWGDYWVLDLASDGRYVVVGEANRKYLWVLSRQPALTSTDEGVVRARLRTLGFDPASVQAHPHTQR